MPKLKHRMIFDLLLSIMLVFEMLYQFTGNALHELVGFAFFACIVAHLLFSRRWISSTAQLVGKKKMNRRRKGLAIMALILLADAIVLGLSSIIISNTLWNLGINLSALNPNDIWSPIHTVSAYGLCAFVLVHLAMHWTQVAGVLKVPYDPSRRRAIGQCVGVAVGVGAVALGVVGAKQVSASTASSMVTALEAQSTQDVSSTESGQAGQSTGTSSSTSEPQASSSGPSSHSGNSHGHRHDSWEGSSSGSGSSSSSGAPSQQGTAPSGPQDSSTGSGSASGSGSSSTASGVCTLCRKQCPLSSPKCDEPYRQGLL